MTAGKRCSILACLGALLLPLASAQKTVNIGKGCTTATTIDMDCDGYGTGSAKGPDADDSDPAVKDYDTAIAKWQTLKAFLAHLGYQPTRYIYLSPSGNNSNGAANDIDHPFATLAGLRAKIKLGPGDIVLARSGTYSETFSVAYPSTSGSPGNPVIFMAFPGERPVWSTASDVVNSVTDINNVVFDGLAFTSPQAGRGRTFFLQGKTENITIRNCESWNRGNGVFAFDNMKGWLIENNVFRDNRDGTHCIYIGSRSLQNQDLTVRGNLLYNCGSTGIQHNGRVANLIVEGNIIHTNKIGGISLVNGVHDSIVRNNLIFNNGTQGIVLYDYSDVNAAIQPYDTFNNVIEHNTVWIGNDSWGQGPETANFMPLDVVNSSSMHWTFPNNTVRNNVFVSHAGPIFRIQQTFLDMKSWIVENNVFYSISGGPMARLYENFSTPLKDFPGLAEFEAMGPSYRNNINANPQFADANTGNQSAPAGFDFQVVAGSPAIGHGVAGSTAKTDIRGRPRSNPPTSGAYEFVEGTAGGGPPGLLVAPDPLPVLALYANPGATTMRLLTINSTGSPVSFTGTSTANNGSWLSLTPANGSTPLTMQVSANAAGLSPGVYDGSIQVAGGASTLQIPVSFTVTDAALPAISGVGTSGGGVAAMVPNTWIEIRGSNLSPVTRTWTESDFQNNQMPSQLDGVRVTVNAKSAFVYYVSPTQLNILTPPDAIQGQVAVEVVNSNGVSSDFVIDTQTLSPSFFTYNGSPYLAAIHADGTLLGPPNLTAAQTLPAKPGETITLYGNGFGTTSPPVTSGSSTQTGALPNLPEITIGSIPARVDFAGLVSPGLFQFNLAIPDTAPAGDLPVTATYNGAQTQAGTLIAVQP